MKQRIKGLIALCLIFCMTLVALPSTTVFASAKSYWVDYSGILNEHSQTPDASSLLFAGDSLSAAFTGGFVVLNGDSGEVLATGNEGVPGEWAYHEDNAGGYVQSDMYRYFFGSQAYVVPQIKGYYGYRYHSIFNTTSSVEPDQVYCTKDILQPGYTAHDCSVLLVYLTPLANTYTVRFDANNGNATGIMEDQIFTYDTTQNLSANGFSATGYIFQNWSTDANEYTDGQAISNLTDENNAVITLVAQWAPVEYTVKFHANGGTGTMEDQTFVYDAFRSLTPTAFTKEGFTFVGWNTEEDGTGVRYTDREIIKNLASTQDAVVDLYAEWKAVSTTTESIAVPSSTQTVAPTTEQTTTQITQVSATTTTAPSATQTTTAVTTVSSTVVTTNEQALQSSVTTVPTTKATTPTSSPNTGDTANLGLLLLTMLSAFCLVLLLRKKTYRE